jgi:hypothetical protein
VSGGNYVHLVWRDFNGDFGRDVLAVHYRKAARAQAPQSAMARAGAAASSSRD